MWLSRRISVAEIALVRIGEGRAIDLDYLRNLRMDIDTQSADMMSAIERLSVDKSLAGALVSVRKILEPMGHFPE